MSETAIANYDQNDRRQADPNKQSPSRLEQLERAAYWQVGNQIAEQLQAEAHHLMVDLKPNLPTILRGPSPDSHRLLTDYDLVLAGEQQKRRGKYDRISSSLGQRLWELDSNTSPNQATEKELLSLLWYEQHGINLGDSAAFHRTRLMLARLKLVTQSAGEVNNPSDDQTNLIMQIAEDECRQAVNQIHAQEMEICQQYCWQIAGEDPEAETRQAALQNLKGLQSSQPIVSPAEVSRATNGYTQFRVSVYQLGELRRVRDRALNPDELANGWLAQLGNQIAVWVADADNACRQNRHQIHLAAKIDQPV